MCVCVRAVRANARRWPDVIAQGVIGIESCLSRKHNLLIIHNNRDEIEIMMCTMQFPVAINLIIPIDLFFYFSSFSNLN